jgi:glutamyl/glutaminyl-tRNA synthetase
MLTRFAPAPTGYLHLGHVANAMLVWREARARGGRVLLRIEDHDGDRSRAGFEAAILDDLDWLGFVPDLYPTSTFRAGICASRQRDRAAIHAEIASNLVARGLVYACRCSRRDVAEAAAPGLDGERPYPGTCRDASVPLDGDVGWRVRMPQDAIEFVDRWCGRQVQSPASQCGDLLIRDRRGHWTYQFAVTVDDHLQGVTDVIRGRDLLSSTGRQVLLGRLIGRAEPAVFAHHPLIMKSPAQKLSKSDADTGVRDLRTAGWSAADVLAEAGRLLVLAGWNEAPY